MLSEELNGKHPPFEPAGLRYRMKPFVALELNTWDNKTSHS